MRSPLLLLPLEILDHVLLAHLTLPDVLALQACCLQLRATFTRKGVWRALLRSLSNEGTRRLRRLRDRDIEQTRKHIQEKWSAVVGRQRVNVAEYLQEVLEEGMRHGMHSGTLKMLRTIEKQNMMRLSPSQSACRHPRLLFFYLRPIPSPPRAVRRTGRICSVCGVECLEAIRCCAICQPPSLHIPSVSCLSCGPLRGHAGHPLCKAEPKAYSAEYCCGCLSCGVSCVVRVSNLHPPSPSSSAAAVDVSFVCLSSQNLFRGVGVAAQRERELLQRMRHLDLLTESTT